MTAAPSLWDWSVERYGRGDAEKRLLALQDDLDLNVNIALWCCWVAAYFEPGPDIVLRKAIDIAAGHERDIVAPIRSARRMAKTRGEAMGALYEELRRVELSAEACVLRDLEALARAQLTEAIEANGAESRARRLLALYADISGAVRREGFSTLLLSDTIAAIFDSDDDLQSGAIPQR